MKVYIAGPVQAHPAPENVREVIKAESGSIEWVDPLEHEVQAESINEIIDIDIELVESCDAIFLYWPPGIMSWGAASELYHATRIEGKPAVVWQTGPLDPALDKVPEWLSGLSDKIVGDVGEGIECLYDL